MRPSVRWLEETYQDQIDFHILNIDHASNSQLIRTFQVSGIPMIVLLNPDGKLVQRLTGYQTQDELIDAVEALIANYSN